MLLHLLPLARENDDGAVLGLHHLRLQPSFSLLLHPNLRALPVAHPAKTLGCPSPSLTAETGGGEHETSSGGAALSEVRLEQVGRCFVLRRTHGEIFALAWRFFSRALFSGLKESSGGKNELQITLGAEWNLSPQRWHRNLNYRLRRYASIPPTWRGRGPLIRVSVQVDGFLSWSGEAIVVGPIEESGPFQSADLQ
jgi:hypothetical protein